MLTGAILRAFANIRHSDATLLGCGISVESKGTGASGSVICAAADRVWTANVFPLAWIWTKYWKIVRYWRRMVGIYQRVKLIFHASIPWHLLSIQDSVEGQFLLLRHPRMHIPLTQAWSVWHCVWVTQGTIHLLSTHFSPAEQSVIARQTATTTNIFLNKINHISHSKFVFIIRTTRKLVKITNFVSFSAIFSLLV